MQILLLSDDLCDSSTALGRGNDKKENEREKMAKGAIDMDTDLWSTLPEHVIERVLPWLPITSILLARLVCKSWVSMVNSRGFSELYSEARPQKDQPWFLVFPRNIANMGLAYDFFSNKWMNLSFSFLPTDGQAVATGGGLACMIPKINNSNALYICNPISRMWRELARPLSLSRFFFLVAALLPDNCGRSFKVVFVGSELVSEETEQFVSTAEVYDSNMDSWTRTRSFLVESPVSLWRTTSCGVLYCVIGRTPWIIVAFDVQRGHWFEVRAPMPEFLTSVKLMDHKGQLVMIGGIGKYGITKEIGIWKLVKSTAEWQKIGGIPKEFCDDFLKSLFRRFACVGHGDLIYFSSKKCPHMLVYDISHQFCHWLHCCPGVADPYYHIFNGFCFEPRLL